MSEMIERVAKAILSCCSSDPNDIGKAAIEAMREPTEAMLDVEPGVAKYIWPKMIDAALKDD